MLTLWVLEETDEAAVALVVEAHDPTPPLPRPSRKEAVRSEIKRASNLQDLKTAVEKLLDL